MLLKHSAAYLLARGLPGLVNFAALAIYTRMLAPDEYGRYALVIASVGLFNVVFFQWMRLSLLRFLPIHLDNPKKLFATIFSAFCGIAFITGLIGLGLTQVWSDPVWTNLIALAIPLLWVQAWMELNLEVARSTLQPGHYGLMTTTRAIAALIFGVMLLYWGRGEYGPLSGLLAATLIVGLVWGRDPWSEHLCKPSKEFFLQFLRYGLPLSATFALGFLISSSDRFLIAHFIDDTTAGIYAASYDLAAHSLTILLVTINLAAYPIVVRMLEHQGVAAAQDQLRRNATLLLSVGLPSSIAFALLANNIAYVILGKEFRENAVHLLPWVALSVLFAGLRAYYFDLAFQLGQKTIIQTWIVGFAATVNIILNILLIPVLGMMGAAYATFAAYGIALLLSAVLSRRVFVLPLPWLDMGKIVVASLVMGLALVPTLEYSGVFMLVGQVVLGLFVFSVVLLALNVGGYRQGLSRRFAK